MACNVLEERWETAGSPVAAAQRLLVAFGAAAFPAERACSQKVAALSGAGTEKAKMNQGDGEACL